MNPQVHRRPIVSLLIALRNEESHVGDTIRAILAQDYPPDRLELLVYDGGSTDRSVEIVRTLLADRPLAMVATNPGRIQ